MTIDHTPAAQAAMQEAVRDAIRKAYDDGYNDAKMAPDNCSTYCVERAVRLDSAALLSKLSAPVADERLSDIERTAITGLISVARAAFNVADDAEDDGDCVKVDRANASALGDALDALDELPDDQPGYSMGPSNKAEWALRRVLGLASAPVAGEAPATDRMVSIAPDAPSLTLAMNAVPLEQDFAKVLSDNFDSLLIHSDAAQPVAWLRETTPGGGVWHRSVSLDEPPTGFVAIDRKTPLYAAPQASEAVQLLRKVREDGYLSDTMNHRIAVFFACQPQASEAVRDGGAETSMIKPESRANPSDTVVLPPLPSPPEHRGHAMFAGSQMEAYARAAVLADRQQRGGDVEAHEKMRDVLQWIVDDAGSGGVAKLRPQQEKRARAALSAQPGAQKENQ